MKIVVLDGYTLNPGDLSWAGLEQFGDLRVYERTQKEDSLGRIGDAEIIFTNKTVLDKDTMQACPNLKFIGVLATGYNVVDLFAATDLGITVCNVPGYSTNTVAQYTFALLLELCNHVGLHDRSVKQGEWENSTDFCYWKKPLLDLHEKTMGIIGFGRIGQAVANIALAFGMKALVYAPRPKEGAQSSSLRFVALDELFRESDIISLHCPLTKETEYMINKESLTLMKRSAMIVNTGRGGLVNEQDLADALLSGQIAAAAVDVVSREPIQSDNPLLKAKNCIITPHIAWASGEARQRLMNITVDNLAAYLSGKPQNVVRP
ncbi:MAG: D-2-hydroxyacid dehydrogenase [Clostridiales bacterium]|nr:D-2-hydroxyacid dehydrogenase [Clostridiales bacterium]